MTADASTLQNRAFAYAFTSSPYIITAFAGPKVAEQFYYQISWRWGFGAWAIITPIVAAPLYIMLKYNLYKAEKEGYRIKRPSGRTMLESIWHWTVQFDREYYYRRLFNPESVSARANYILTQNDSARRLDLYGWPRTF